MLSSPLTVPPKKESDKKESEKKAASTKTQKKTRRRKGKSWNKKKKHTADLRTTDMEIAREINAISDLYLDDLRFNFMDPSYAFDVTQPGGGEMFEREEYMTRQFQVLPLYHDKHSYRGGH